MHPRRIESCRESSIELADDRLWRVLGEEQPKPGVDFEIGETLLGRARQVWNLRRPFSLQDGDPLDRIAVDQRLTGCAQGANVVVAASDQILHRRATAAVGDVGNILD